MFAEANTCGFHPRIHVIFSPTNAKFRRYSSLRKVSPMPPPAQPKKQQDWEQWNQALTEFKAGSFFHTGSWARVLIDAYGFVPRYCVEKHPNGTTTLLPVFESRFWPTQKRAVSLPFTDEIAALSTSDETKPPPIFATVMQHGKSLSWASWEYRGGRKLFPDAPASHSYFGHALALNPDSEAMFAQLDGNARTAVRKARQNGLFVEFSTDISAVRIFYRQLCATRRRQGMPPQPFDFFAAIHRHVLTAGRGLVAVARKGDIPVASAVFFHHEQTAIYKFAASDFALRHLQGSHLVLWSAIERYGQAGLRLLDFGRTSRLNVGLRRFKLAWRPRERDIEYVKYDLRRLRYFDAQAELTTGFHNRIFRLLPSSVSRLISAALYKHMA